MSRVIESNVKKFPGKIYFPDFLTAPQVVTFADALVAAQGKNRFTADQIIMPALFGCIEKLEIEGQPEKPTLDNFHFTPSKSASELIAQMILEVHNMILAEEEVPNA